MNDTVMTASVRISNNDILSPEIVIPVTFEMTENFITSVLQDGDRENQLLGQNFPNPFENATTISMNLTEKSQVVLSVYSQDGKLVEELVNEVLDKGTHEVDFPARQLPAGLYYYMLQTPQKIVTRKMMIK